MNDARLTIIREFVSEPPLRFIEGYCQDASELPTTNIAEGSNVIEVPTGDWYFYDETDGWDVMLNIKQEA